jgi:hypothetical protein
MSGGSTPSIETPKVEETPEEPDILFGEDEEKKKKKKKASGTKSLQVPVGGSSGKSGLGIPG